jgi:hypothetical protein
MPVRGDTHSRVAIVVLLLLVVTIVSAQTRRQAEPICSENGPKRVQLKDTDLSILGVAIGKSSLTDVQSKLGKAGLIRVSKEEESDVSICYVSPTDGTVLAFYSGAMGGWKDLTWFALWSREAAFPQAAECTTSKLVSRSLSTASGLKLDISRTEMETLAGKPTKSGIAAMKYDYLCRRKITDEEIKRFKANNNWDVTNDPYFDRMSWIEAHFKESKVVRIDIGEIESY